MTNPSEITLIDAKGIDAVIENLNTLLAAEFTWLTTYGRADDFYTDPQDPRTKQPGVYLGGSEYLSMIPDEALGSYCFWKVDPVREWVDDEEYIETAKRVDLNLIIWYDIEDPFPGGDSQRSTEDVNDLLETFFKSSSFNFYSLRLLKLYEGYDQVFKGYKIQDFMRTSFFRPWAGMRIHLECVFYKKC